MAKKVRNITITRNYLYKRILDLWIQNRAKLDPETGERRVVAVMNGGGSRAGKTYVITNLIYTIMTHFADPKSKGARALHIIIYRDTLVSARATYKDVIDCFTGMGLLEGMDEQIRRGQADYKTTNSAEVKIEMYGHLIQFKGLPEEGKEPSGCDISFINELIEHKNKHAFDGIKRRTRLLLMADWNPKDSVHWAYNLQGHNIFYTVTTYWDNKHLPDGLKAEMEQECPWEFDDSELYLETYDDYGKQINKRLPEGFNFIDWKKGNYDFDGFIRRRWLKPERPENCREEEYHLYRRVNALNESNLTINRASWLTYGEGISSGQAGAIFHDVKWVKEFPNSVDMSLFGLDFGFSNDPSCLTIVGNIGMDMYIKKLTYTKTPTSDILWDLIERPILNEEKRRYIEANGEDWDNRLGILRYEVQKAASIMYENSDLRSMAIDEAKANLIEFKDSGVEIDRIRVICDTADVYKGRGGAEEQQFVSDLNRLSIMYGYYWSFEKVGAKPIVPRISLMKKFNLCLIEDDDLKAEQQNYCYIKDSAGNLTNMPDKDSKWTHALVDSAGYAIWKGFKHLVVRNIV